MCGLAGYMGTGTPSPDKLRILLLVNEDRGTHSTGIFGTKLMKKAEKASLFITDDNFDSIVKSNIVLGHTRQATGGAITKENAHPFLISDKLVGTHNGWLVNEYEIKEKYDVEASVDSHALYKLMGKLDDPRAFTKAEGAMALAFKFDGQGYLYRRPSRPLFVGQVKDGYYYSSILEALYMIGVPKTKCYDLDPHNLYRINPVDGKIFKSPIEKPRIDMGPNTYMSTWDAGVDKGLVEQLTGKKQYPVATTGGQKATGDGTQTNGASSRNYSTQGNQLTEAQRNEIYQKTKIFGEKLSESVKTSIFNIYTKDYSIIQKSYYNNGYGPFKNLITTNPVDEFLNDDVMKNSFSHRIEVKEISTTYQVHKTAFGLNVNMMGTIEDTGLFELDTSQFIFVVYPCTDQNRKEVFNYGTVKKPKMNIYFQNENLTSESSNYYHYLDIIPKFMKGLVLTTTVPLRKGFTTSINAYIPIELLAELGEAIVNNGEVGKLISKGHLPVTRDITRLQHLRDLNKDISFDPAKDLPVLNLGELYSVDTSVKKKEDQGDSEEKLIRASRYNEYIEAIYELTEELRNEVNEDLGKIKDNPLYNEWFFSLLDITKSLKDNLDKQKQLKELILKELV